MEGRLDNRSMRRAVCLKIDGRLHALYETVLHEEVPERFIVLMSGLDEPHVSEEKESPNAM